MEPNRSSRVSQGRSWCPASLRHLYLVYCQMDRFDNTVSVLTMPIFSSRVVGKLIDHFYHFTKTQLTRTKRDARNGDNIDHVFYQLFGGREVELDHMPISQAKLDFDLTPLTPTPKPAYHLFLTRTSTTQTKQRGIHSHHPNESSQATHRCPHYKTKRQIPSALTSDIHLRSLSTLRPS
jgi:hypothetical protein